MSSPAQPGDFITVSSTDGATIWSEPVHKKDAYILANLSKGERMLVISCDSGRYIFVLHKNVIGYVKDSFVKQVK